MALYTVVQGATANALDLDQYYNLLTGGMTDQQVSISNRVRAQMAGAGAGAGGLVGMVNGAAPASGTFVLGDTVLDEAGGTWVCLSAGSPGIWGPVGSVKFHDEILSVDMGVGAVKSIALPSGNWGFVKASMTGYLSVTSPQYTYITFNSDHSAVYYSSDITWTDNGSTPLVNDSMAAVKGRVGWTSSKPTSGNRTTHIIEVDCPTDSISHPYIGRTTHLDGGVAGNLGNGVIMGHYARATTITSIDFDPGSGGWAANTRFQAWAYR